MSSPLRSCEEDEGMVVNSEGGDFDEDDEDEDGGGGAGGEPDDGNASDINSPAAPRESATAAAPGTVQEERGVWKSGGGGYRGHKSHQQENILKSSVEQAPKNK